MVNSKTLSKLFEQTPRYTSYPPIPYWGSIDPQVHMDAMRGMQGDGLPLSIYIHIPFCRQRCLFCGCNVVASRNEQVQNSYLSALKKEISLVAKQVAAQAVQIHFGGGTPTSLSKKSLEDIVSHLRSCFPFDPNKEMAIEVDPRTIQEKDDLLFLRQLGFNRMSLGVQDLDPKVQQAIGRIHSKEQVAKVYGWAREVGFRGINVDLIYGLPHQSIDTFQQTIKDVVAWSPDRIVLFSFAYVPQLKPHQKALDETACATPLKKHNIFTCAREKLLENGYLDIGIDHFVNPKDPLAIAYKNRTMKRNFQGYDLGLSPTLIGFGVSAISHFNGGFFQNAKDLNDYLAALEHDLLPIRQGKLLNSDDRIRGWVIEQIMCGYEIDKKRFRTQFNVDFDAYFATDLEKIRRENLDTFYINDHNQFAPSSLGKLFLRNLAYCFDGYTS